MSRVRMTGRRCESARFSMKTGHFRKRYVFQGRLFFFLFFCYTECKGEEGFP